MSHVILSLTSSMYRTGVENGKHMARKGMAELEMCLEPTWCLDDFKNEQGGFFTYINSLMIMNSGKLSHYASKCLLQKCLPPNKPLVAAASGMRRFFNDIGNVEFGKKDNHNVLLSM